jgi:hypothetical protein
VTKDDGLGIRWDAWTHHDITSAVDTEEDVSAISLADSVTAFRLIVGDLREIRSFYDQARRRLAERYTGPSATAAGTTTLVTRGLTSAQELADRAGADRVAFAELNERVRLELPRPFGADWRAAFLDGGLNWLRPPDFHALEKDELNQEERARDIMRSYAQQLVEGTPATSHDQADARRGPPSDESTVPFAKRSPTLLRSDLVGTTVAAPRADAAGDNGFGPVGHGHDGHAGTDQAQGVAAGRTAFAPGAADVVVHEDQYRSARGHGAARLFDLDEVPWFSVIGE